MDPQMGSIIAQEVADSKDLIRKQLAWNSEKHRFHFAIDDYLIQLTNYLIC